MDSNNSEQLLRPRAVAHKVLGPTSTPVDSIRSPIKLQLGIGLILLAVAISLLIKTSYKETIPARGVLSPKQALQKITSPVTAKVSEIHVRLGEHVQKGDVLATLSTDFHDESGRSVHRQRIEQLHAARTLLSEQFATQQRSIERSALWQSESLENIQENKALVEAELAILTTKIELSGNKLEAARKLLEAGNSSTSEFERFYQSHLDLLGGQQVLKQRLLQQEHQKEALNNTAKIEQMNSQRESLAIQRDLLEMERQLDSVEQQTNLSIVAGDAGLVAELGLELGQPVLMNQPLFFILPERTELEATIYVPAAVQAKLSPNQEVLIRYDAFDYRLYGRQQAVVRTVGQASLNPQENVLAVSGLNESVFKVTADLRSESVEGESHYQLRAGSTLIADFIVSEMSLLQFIFKPILGLRDKIA